MSKTEQVYRVLKPFKQYNRECVVDGEKPRAQFRKGYVFTARESGWNHALGPQFSIMANPMDDSPRTHMYRRDLEVLEENGAIEKISAKKAAKAA